MKVVWVSHRSGLAGAELSLLEGTRGLVARGVMVEVVLPWAGPLGDRLRELGAGFTVLPHARWASEGRSPVNTVRRLVRNARSLRSFVGLLRGSGADLVVTNTVTAPLGAVAARLARVPHVWYVHEYGLEEHGVRFDLGRRTSLRLVGLLSDVVLVNSEALRAALAPLLCLEPTRVYYAVDVPDREAPPAGEGPLRLVQVGTLAPGKGQLEAVRALGILARRGADVRLRLVGPDLHGHAATVLHAARSEQVADRLEWVGYAEDPAEHVLAADVALTCSRMEAFGRTTVEAMKLGRPVVGAASGGTGELVRDGWNGLLYPPGDAEALADRIERLDRDRALLRKLAASAREWARATFTLERFADDLVAVFEVAVADRRAP